MKKLFFVIISVWQLLHAGGEPRLHFGERVYNVDSALARRYLECKAEGGNFTEPERNDVVVEALKTNLQECVRRTVGDSSEKVIRLGQMIAVLQGVAGAGAEVTGQAVAAGALKAAGAGLGAAKDVLALEAERQEKERQKKILIEEVLDGELFRYEEEFSQKSRLLNEDVCRAIRSKLSLFRHDRAAKNWFDAFVRTAIALPVTKKILLGPEAGSDKQNLLEWLDSDPYFRNFGEEIRAIFMQEAEQAVLASEQEADFSARHIYIWGNPGIGKSNFCKKLAAAQGRPFYRKTIREGELSRASVEGTEQEKGWLLEALTTPAETEGLHSQSRLEKAMDELQTNIVRIEQSLEDLEKKQDPLEELYTEEFRALKEKRREMIIQLEQGEIGELLKEYKGWKRLALQLALQPYRGVRIFQLFFPELIVPVIKKFNLVEKIILSRQAEVETFQAIFAELILLDFNKLDLVEKLTLLRQREADVALAKKSLSRAMFEVAYLQYSHSGISEGEEIEKMLGKALKLAQDINEIKLQSQILGKMADFFKFSEHYEAILALGRDHPKEVDEDVLDAALRFLGVKKRGGGRSRGVTYLNPVVCLDDFDKQLGVDETEKKHRSDIFEFLLDFTDPVSKTFSSPYLGNCELDKSGMLFLYTGQSEITAQNLGDEQAFRGLFGSRIQQIHFPDPTIEVRRAVFEKALQSSPELQLTEGQRESLWKKVNSLTDLRILKRKVLEKVRDHLRGRYPLRSDEEHQSQRAAWLERLEREQRERAGGAGPSGEYQREQSDSGAGPSGEGSWIDPDAAAAAGSAAQTQSFTRRRGGGVGLSGEHQREQIHSDDAVATTEASLLEHGDLQVNPDFQADKGDPAAQYYYGLSFFEGNGTEKNLAEAAKWFRSAAEQGHIEAQFKLGVCYELAWGVEGNRSEALTWYLRAAEGGSVEAQVALQQVEKTDQGDAGAGPSVEGSRLDPDAAASAGSAAQTQFFASRRDGGAGPSVEGQGEQTHSDDVVATAEASLSEHGDLQVNPEFQADKGDPAAQYHYGLSFFEGNGIERDLVEAAKWFRSAAEQGHIEAQFKLGTCYEHAWGVECNLSEAMAWYLRAAEGGSAEAQVALQQVEKTDQGDGGAGLSGEAKRPQAAAEV